MNILRVLRLIVGATLLPAAAGCLFTVGGTVGGTLSGLSTGATVVLQNNGADKLTLTGNGTFTFATAIASGSDYNVTVLTQPAGQTCSVTNASGTIDTNSDDVTSVSVTCAAAASLGGTLSGLAAGTSVTLSNAGVSLAIAANGAFAFPGTLPDGTAYNVTVVTQPVGQTCAVANPSGTIKANVLASVTVTCG